jgi:hypothetical protein
MCVRIWNLISTAVMWLLARQPWGAGPLPAAVLAAQQSALTPHTVMQSSNSVASWGGGGQSTHSATVGHWVRFMMLASGFHVPAV